MELKRLLTGSFTLFIHKTEHFQQKLKFEKFDNMKRNQGKTKTFFPVETSVINSKNPNLRIDNALRVDIEKQSEQWKTESRMS